MTEENIKIEDLISSLAAASSICAPDEYQSRHNLLVRQVALYLTQNEMNNLEGEIE